MDAASILPVSENEDDPNRAKQLLAAMHDVCSHDLPNQLVIVQALVNLLETEEKNSLNQPAQEYVTRLIAAAKRAGVMVQFLKDMARIQRLQEPIETIELAHLGEELRAEATHLFAARRLAFAFDWEVANVRAGPRALKQALLELLRCGLESCSTISVEIRFASSMQDDSTVVDLVVAAVESGDWSRESSPGISGTLPVNRLEVRLAHALAATWGGALEVTSTPACFSVCLHVPSNRS